MIFHNQLCHPVSKKRCVEGLFIPKDRLLFDSRNSWGKASLGERDRRLLFFILVKFDVDCQ